MLKKHDVDICEILGEAILTNIPDICFLVVNKQKAGLLSRIKLLYVKILYSVNFVLSTSKVPCRIKKIKKK